MLSIKHLLAKAPIAALVRLPLLRIAAIDRSVAPAVSNGEAFSCRSRQTEQEPPPTMPVARQRGPAARVKLLLPKGVQE